MTIDVLMDFIVNFWIYFENFGYLDVGFGIEVRNLNFN